MQNGLHHLWNRLVFAVEFDKITIWADKESDDRMIHEIVIRTVPCGCFGEVDTELSRHIYYLEVGRDGGGENRLSKHLVRMVGGGPTQMERQRANSSKGSESTAAETDRRRGRGESHEGRENPFGVPYL
jgi:hypothetical protein